MLRGLVLAAGKPRGHRPGLQALDVRHRRNITPWMAARWALQVGFFAAVPAFMSLSSRQSVLNAALQAAAIRREGRPPGQTAEDVADNAGRVTRGCIMGNGH